MNDKKQPTAAELLSPLMEVLKAARLDESVKACSIMISEAVSRMFPDDHGKQMQMCEYVNKQIIAHIKMRAVIQHELKPVMEKAEAERRVITKEELEESFNELKAKLKERLEKTGGPKSIEGIYEHSQKH